MKQEIKINGKPYKIGFSFRAIREYEKLTGESITNCTTTWDNLLFFYSTLKSQNETFTYTLPEFIDEMDSHPELLAQFQAETTTAKADPNPSTAGQKKSLFNLWMLSLLLSVSPILLPVTFGIVWIWTSLQLLARLTAKIGKKLASLFSH